MIEMAAIFLLVAACVSAFGWLVGKELSRYIVASRHMSSRCDLDGDIHLRGRQSG